MQVYLVRHAIAFDRDAERWPDDSLRPLTEAGRRTFERAARGLRRLVPEVDVALSSPYVRAWQTAEILAAEAGWPAPRPEPELAHGGSPAGVVARLSGLGAGRVALVGHEPDLSGLLAYLLTGDEGGMATELKKGAVVRVDFGGRPAAGEGVLRWLAQPKLLRALSGA